MMTDSVITNAIHRKSSAHAIDAVHRHRRIRRRRSMMSNSRNTDGGDIAMMMVVVLVMGNVVEMDAESDAMNRKKMKNRVTEYRCR